jgi:dethiobiotin synthetase
MAVEKLITVKNTCPAIFITGTGTGVGKTLVAAALARHFSSQGLNVGVMKPIETGVVNREELGADATLLKWAAGSKDDAELISPYRFSQPVAPCQAATSAKEPIDTDKICKAFQILRQGKDIVLVEGAGGLMVPIRGGYIMADLARQLALPLLVITHPRLGTLNHTLLTTFAARAMELELCGYMINQMPENPDEAEKEAPHLLSSLASADLLGVLPEVTGSDQEKVKLLSKKIDELPAYQWLLNGLGLQQ